MTGIDIITTNNTLTLVYNGYATQEDTTKKTWCKNKIRYISLHQNFVQLDLEGDGELILHHQDVPDIMFFIETVDTVAPTSLTDLYDKLVTTLG